MNNLLLYSFLYKILGSNIFNFSNFLHFQSEKKIISLLLDFKKF